MMLKVRVDVNEGCFTLVIAASSHVTSKHNCLGNHVLPSSSCSTCVGLNVCVCLWMPSGLLESSGVIC
jgi:hypothetical protein